MTTFTNKLSINPRLLAILNLGFVSGLPLSLTGTTLQAWFTQSGISLMTIGALSLVGLPYTLKFLWAPLMDHYGFSRVNKRKGWILLMQLALLASIILLSYNNPQKSSLWMAILALTVAFFSASQDISITAYQTDLLLPHERGMGAACYVFAYRIATLMAGGFALVIANYLGWMLTYQIMALLVGVSMVITYFSPDPKPHSTHTTHLWATIYQAFCQFLARDRMLLLLCFVLTYKLGDALALSLMTNFMLKGLGFTLIEIGVAYKSVSIVAMILGGFLGGIILARISILKALLFFGLAQALSNLLFVGLALVGKHFWWMMMAVGVENFCSGLSTAALLAFLMSLCDKRFSATQFALLSAVASLPRVFLGPVASLLVSEWGWVVFFTWSVVLSFPGLLCLLGLGSFYASNSYHSQALALGSKPD